MKNTTILNLFLHPFKTQKYIYCTNLSVEKLRAEIDFLINQKDSLDILYYLAGTLDSDNSFELKGRGIVKGSGPLVTINGKLVAIKEIQTNIEISIVPNKIFTLFPIFFGIVGVATLIYSMFNPSLNTSMWLVALLATVICWATLKYSKTYYKSEFEKALDLVNPKHIIEIIEN